MKPVSTSFKNTSQIEWNDKENDADGSIIPCLNDPYPISRNGTDSLPQIGVSQSSGSRVSSDSEKKERLLTMPDIIDDATKLHGQNAKADRGTHLWISTGILWPLTLRVDLLRRLLVDLRLDQDRRGE